MVVSSQRITEKLLLDSKIIQGQQTRIFMWISLEIKETVATEEHVNKMHRLQV